MGEVHSHHFQPVGQIWLRGEENELCCDCGEKLWVIFEDSQSPQQSLRGKFRERFDRHSRVQSA